MTDVDQALGEPGAALLSAVVHAQSAHAVLAARAGLFAGTTFAADAEPYYTDLIFGLLSTADQSQLEAAMQQLEPRLPIPMTVPKGYKPWDFVRESAVAEGKAQGKAQGEAQARERLRQALRNGQGTTRSLWCCKERRVGCEAASLRPTKQARTVQVILGQFLSALLAKRGLVTTADDDARMAACEDSDVLLGWLVAAATATERGRCLRHNSWRNSELPISGRCCLRLASLVRYPNWPSPPHGLTYRRRSLNALQTTMPRAITIHEAKTHFSKLADRAHAGELTLVQLGGAPARRERSSRPVPAHF